jgi:hypothetical protein
MAATLPFSPRLHQLNPPGMTPISAHHAAPPTPDGSALQGPPHDAGQSAARAPQPPPERHRYLVAVEDVLLVLLLVFMVPITMILLALPLVGILKVAEEVSRRW